MSTKHQQRNHFVSQLLLKRFAHKGGQQRNSVLVFTKERADEGLREELIEEICQYPGIFDEDAEDLCQSIESKGRDALNKLTKSIKGKRPLDLTESDRDNLNMFVVSLIVRSMPILHASAHGTPFLEGVENFLFGKIGGSDAEEKGEITREVVNDAIQEVLKRRYPRGRIHAKLSERPDLQLATGSIPFAIINELDPDRRWENGVLTKRSSGGIWVPENLEDSGLTGLIVDTHSSECSVPRMWVPIHSRIAMRLSEKEEDEIESDNGELIRAINWKIYNNSPEIIVQSESHLLEIQASSSLSP